MSLRLSKYSSKYDQNLIKEAFDVVRARKKAIQRGFPEWCRKGFFLPHILEQATHPTVAQHHAKRIGVGKKILEIGTGAAIDTAAFVVAGCSVTSIENDSKVAEYARYNLALTQLSRAEIVTADVIDWFSKHSIKNFDAVWADPSRRTGTHRVSKEAEKYSPPLSWIIEKTESLPCGIKISPTVSIEQKDNWRSEWIGFQGECKERILWKNIGPASTTVTIIESGESFAHSERHRQNTILTERLEDFVLDGDCYLFIPHPALVASGLLGEFYGENDIFSLDRALGYGIRKGYQQISSFCKQYRILEIHSYDEALLQRRITALGWGPGTQFHKRGDTPLPDDLWKRIKFTPGGLPGHVILGRKDKRLILLLAEQV